MPLAAGQTLSFYEILGPLGAGAMGEVYRARDTRLEREVAVKVLPEHFASDEERLRRFEREARTLASLSHPNLAHVYGIDRVDDTCFMAMELVSGEDLADKLRRGALPVPEALDIGRQIAEGLEVAHDAGVVHRDLKPANVRVTSEGVVKLLDFGLAKALDSGSKKGAVTTEVGRVLGTPTYMSPEQSRGQTVDSRTDVWAFGCILFECLAGRRTFEGESITDVLVALAEREPDWAALPRDTPASVRGLLRRCLDKDSRARLRHVGEARILLEDPHAPALDVAGNNYVTRGRWAVLALVALLSATAGLLLRPDSEEAAQSATVRLGLELPPGQRLDLPNPRAGGLDGVAPPLAISPDGATLAYVASEEGPLTHVYVRPLDSFESRLIPGTQNAEAPFFSSDGVWVGFFRDGGIYKAPVLGGGDPELVCPLTTYDRPSATWGPDGTIVFSRGINTEGLESVRESGGDSVELTVPDLAAGESWHGVPHFLPGGRRILFTISMRSDSSMSGTRAAVLELETGERRLVQGMGEAAGARYFPHESGDSGQLIYAQSGRLAAIPFDLDSCRVLGVPQTVVDQISSSNIGIGHWDCSDNAVLVYVAGNMAQDELVLVDRRGEVTWMGPDVGVYQHPRISPDQQTLLFDQIQSGGRDIWVIDLERKTSSQLTSRHWNIAPLWSPDGSRIVFSRLVKDIRTLHSLEYGRAGAEATRLLDWQGYDQVAGTWTKEGVLLFTKFGEVNQELWRLPSGSDTEPELVLNRPRDVGWGAMSPDGRHLAYVEWTSGRLEVYVCSYPSLTEQQKVSSNGGSEPLWSPAGDELFFRNGTDFLTVPITKDRGRLAMGTQETLFGGAYDHSGTGHQHYDVAEDGETFALVRYTESATKSELRVIQNWRPREDARDASRRR